MEENINLEPCPKVMCFENDDEFFDFAVNPLIRVMEDPKSGTHYYDYDLTTNYNDALKDNVEFIIRDPNSLISKRNCVSYKLISKKIQNMHPYYYEDDLKYFYPDFKPMNMICDCEK